MSLNGIIRQSGANLAGQISSVLSQNSPAVLGSIRSLGYDQTLLRWKATYAEPTQEHWENQEVSLTPQQQPKPQLHPSLLPDEKGKDYLLMHPVYDPSYLHTVKPRHVVPQDFQDKIAYCFIQTVRSVFDKATGYGPNMNEMLWLRRIVFLETVAGVPGMVGGMLRHLHSLRTMKRDNGWIHTLLEEAENERMHLLTFLQLRQPGVIFRTSVILAQGLFFNTFFLAYLVSPKLCHRMVGYLEEEAIKTYTHCLHDIETGRLPWDNRPAPKIAIDYWKLAEDATMKDVILAVRADEACHSHVNHTFAGMGRTETNPFSPGTHVVP